MLLFVGFEETSKCELHRQFSSLVVEVLFSWSNVILNLEYVQHLHRDVQNDQATLKNDMCHITAITVNNRSVNQMCDKSNFGVKIKIDFY